MATALKLRSDIKKLKKGLEAKGVSASLKEKLKSQLKKAEDELESLKKTGKAPKKSSVAGTKVALTALQKLIQRKKYGVYQGAGVDLKKDAGEGALATGRRVSKGLKSNQNGDKSDNKGNVYYEYRPNRLDVKQPKKRQTYPKLEDGGMMANGGQIKEGKVTWKDDGRYGETYLKINGSNESLFLRRGLKQVWFGDIIKYKILEKNYDAKTNEKGVSFNFKGDVIELISINRNGKEIPIKRENGGYMADGGMIKVEEDAYGKSAYIPYKGETFLLEWNTERPTKASTVISDRSFRRLDEDSSLYQHLLVTLLKAMHENKVQYAEEGAKLAKGGYMADGGEVGVGDKVIFKDNKYRVSKITNENVGGFIDTKWHLDSTKIGVKDVVLDSPKGITKISDSEYMANSGYMADGGQTQGKNGYVAFYKGKRIEVYADTMYQAQLKAAKIFNAKKSYEVNVVLAEVDGKQYYNSTMADGGMMAKGGNKKYWVIADDKRGELYVFNDGYYNTKEEAEDALSKIKIPKIVNTDTVRVESVPTNPNYIALFDNLSIMADGGHVMSTTHRMSK